MTVLPTASSPESIALCRSLGADVIIDYRREDSVARVRPETGGQRCPVILDCVGLDTLNKSMSCIAVDGRLVTIVGGQTLDRIRDLFIRCATLHREFMGVPALSGLRLERQATILRPIAQVVDQGRLKVHVRRVLGLADLAQGHRLLEAGHMTGKIAVRVR